MSLKSCTLSSFRDPVLLYVHVFTAVGCVLYIRTWILIAVIFSHRERGKSLYMAAEVAVLCVVLVNLLRVVDDVYCCAVCNL